MIDWDDLRHFLAVARASTLNGAAAALKINPTTVGRRLAALEDQIGARLFDRTADGYLLTQAGRDLLPRAERMEAEALEIEIEITGADQRLEGVVRVTATEMLATRFIVPELARFHADNPGITVELVCTNRSLSLSRREADIALRLARPKEENVVTRRLASIPLGLYAAPSYLERRGHPEDAERSLAGHDVILFADTRAFKFENEWFHARLPGAAIRLRSDSVSSIYAAALAGVGIALLPEAVAEKDPGLCRVRTESAPEPRVVWQTVHQDLQHTPRIRRVLDFLAALLAPPAPR